MERTFMRESVAFNSIYGWVLCLYITYTFCNTLNVKQRNVWNYWSLINGLVLPCITINNTLNHSSHTVAISKACHSSMIERRADMCIHCLNFHQCNSYYYPLLLGCEYMGASIVSIEKRSLAYTNASVCVSTSTYMLYNAKQLICVCVIWFQTTATRKSTKAFRPNWYNTYLQHTKQTDQPIVGASARMCVCVFTLLDSVHTI